MRFKIDKLMELNNIALNFDSDISFLIGDNGVGKTLLLETYSFINDFYLDKLNQISRKGMEDIIEYQLSPSFKEKSQTQTDYRFEINVEFINQDQLKNKIEQQFINWNQELNQQIRKKVLKNQIEISTVDFLSNIELDVFHETIKFKVILKIDESENISRVILRNNDYRANIPTSLIEDISLQELIDSIENNHYLFLDRPLSRAIITLLSSEIISKNNFKNIIYMPSEKTASLNQKLLDLLKDSNFSTLRYSDKKFSEFYLKSKEMLDLIPVLQQNTDFSNEYMKLLNGTPIFDAEGEVSGIQTTDGSLIDRTLFSTKQNRLFPFYLLEKNFLRFSRTRTRNSVETLIIIEEPEAHLSLKGINDMANYLYALSSKSQIVISTHSDVMLSRLNNLYLKHKFSYSGYEIVKNNDQLILKQMQLNEPGLESEFITNQLLELLHTTTELQNNIDG